MLSMSAKKLGKAYNYRGVDRPVMPWAGAPRGHTVDGLARMSPPCARAGFGQSDIDKNLRARRWSRRKSWSRTSRACRLVLTFPAPSPFRVYFARSEILDDGLRHRRN